MDLKLVHAFVVTAQSRTFSAAATKLRLTQPALTKQIQALERRAGSQLFVRGRRGARLTDAGRTLLADAAELDRRAKEFDRRLERLAAGLEGHLSLGFGLSSIDLAPRLVADFQSCHPEIGVVLDDIPSTVQVERVRAGTLDGAFVRLPVPRDLRALVLAEDGLAIACATGVQLPDAGPQELEAWLTGHPLIRLRPARGPGLTAQVETLCDELGCWPTVIQEAEDLQTVLALVAAGLGAAVVPSSAARIAPSSVQVVSIVEPSTTWRVGLAWNPASVSGPMRNFLSLAGAP